MILGDVTSAIVDCEHKTAPTEASGFPSIRTTDIKNGRLLLHQANRVSARTYKEWTARLEPIPGDLIMAREAPVGEVGIVPEGQRVCLGQRTVLLRPDESKVVPRYLLYLLLTPEMRHAMISRAEGSTTPHLNMSDIRTLPIPELPPVEYQGAIAQLLGALDDKIELNRRINGTLEAIARAIFKSWFVDRDPQPSMSQAGWQTGTFGNVAENPRDQVSPGDVTVDTPYIGLEHMPRKSIALSDWGKAGDVASNKFAFRAGDILFGKLRPYFHKVGVAAIDGVCSTDILVIRPKNPDWFGFVLGHASSTEMVDFATAGSTGTKMPRTSWNELSRFEISIPPDEIAKAFNTIVLPLVQKIKANVHEPRTLGEIRDALLPRLISGEIRINQAEKLIEAHA